jgi:serine/threonine protein kinase
MASKSAQAASVGWKLGEQLGQGGQGDVMLATRSSDPGGQQYAFKFLNDKGSTKARERFRNELTALISISHPGVVKVVECAQPDDSFQYYVMEYVHGFQSLRKRMERKTNPFFKDPLKSVDGFVQIIDAMSACEKLGIVHRDLSPANVLVTDDGRVKLIDFGLCHVDEGHLLTLTDEAVGTPHYRAPECSGFVSTPIDVRADLYSAGKLLWSMVTNRAAFDREKPVFNAQSLARELPGVAMSWHLHHIFEKTIRQNPAQRYVNAGQALDGARHVRHLITGCYTPLELLAGDICQMCGVGKYGELPAAYVKILGQYTLKLIPYQNAFSVCPYCFHLSFQAADAQRQVLLDRSALE